VEPLTAFLVAIFMSIAIKPTVNMGMTTIVPPEMGYFPCGCWKYDRYEFASLIALILCWFFSFSYDGSDTDPQKDLLLGIASAAVILHIFLLHWRFWRLVKEQKADANARDIEK